MKERVDAAGTTCFYYDSLHRLTDAGNGGGSNPVCRRYRYDSRTVNGVAMSNAAGRLSEIATDNCTNIQYTDEGFSYSPRGELTDVYQSTPHSGGYYHVSASYWDNGALNTLSGIPSVPTMTYGVDVGGRPYSVSASSGQNPVTSAGYNAAGQLIGLSFGSGDNDSFGYDPNTGRLTQYKYNVGTAPQTVEGDLTWYENGTVKMLAITDGTSPGKSETCNYAYDDVGRIAGNGATPGVQCTNGGQTVWQQTFSYDPFGNVSKSGTSSFLPAYSSASNQFTNIPGVSSPYYDSRGNLIKDGAHTYTWDQNWGNLSSVDSKTLIFDALGRMVEQASGGSYTQLLYGPTGGKLALMNGQTLQKAFVPLMGGAQAVYNASGLYSYRHADWLGSNRLAVSPSRTVLWDAAYAPFGETYNGAPGNDPSFTGQNQDTATGLYDFLFRELSPVQGRWLVPDPAGLAAVDLTNPQTWNRYAYVMNNPLNYVDPLGLYCAIDPETGGLFHGCNQGAGFGGYDTTVWGAPTAYCCSFYGAPEGIPDGLVITVIFPFANLQGPEDGGDTGTPIYCNPDVIKAMTSSWTQTGNGTTPGKEAGFVLNGTPSNYNIVPQKPNGYNSLLLTIMPGISFALFHVHPVGGGAFPSTPQNTSGEPGGGDTTIANKYFLDVYVMSSQGLTMYNWRTGQTSGFLRKGTTFTKPCSSVKK